MPLPDRAALDRIYAVLRAWEAGAVDAGAVVSAVSLVIEATGRPLQGDPHTAARLDLVDWLIARDAIFEPPDAVGHVWAHFVSAGLRQSINVSAEDPAQTLAELKMGGP